MRKTREKVYQYTAVFEQNESGGYTISVPALPGLVTEGKDLENARFMAEDAIRCYLGGLRRAQEAIPEERDVAHVRVSVSI